MANFNIHNINKENPVIAWWSGGVTSAVTCKLCVDWFGAENVRIVFIDTNNEHSSTYTFMHQCEKWYGVYIERISNLAFKTIREVWYHYKSLNVATGAICSTTLKREVREKFQLTTKFSHQAFGFDTSELHRAKAMKLNHQDSRPIFPLIAEILSKQDCFKIIEKANDLFTQLDIPEPYKMGYKNNNCFETMCVQGGIGYWQKVYREQPVKFQAMAIIEHELTDLRGEPVTMLRYKGKPLFLLHNDNYPKCQNIMQIEGIREPKPLLECNGFCGTNDLKRNKQTEREINYEAVAKI